MSTAGRVVGLGLAASVGVGAYVWLTTETLWIGVLAGVSYPVVAALALWRSWGAKGLAGLTLDQRQHVFRAMRKGQAMDDPQLLSAHWQYGNYVLTKPYSPAVLYTLLGIGTVCLGASVVIGLVAHGPSSLVSNLSLLVSALVMIYVVTTSGRYREQVARSMNATEALVQKQLV